MIGFFKQLAKEKGGVCLSEAYVNSKTKLLYECKDGHQWLAFPGNSKRGHWCPKCSALEKAKKKKTPIEIFKRIAEAKGGKCLSNSCLSQNSKLLIECSKGHQWYVKAANIKRGDWCRKCFNEISGHKQKERRKNSGKPYIDLAILQEIAVERSGKLFSTEYKNATTKLLWECGENHQWWSTAQNIRAGNWCKKCSSKKAAKRLKKTIKDCKNLAELEGGYCLSESYIDSQTNLLWKCKEGHTWEATYANVKRGTWCKICSRKKAGLKRRTPFSFFQDYALSKGGACMSKSYSKQTDKLEFKCANGHKWTTVAGVIKNNKTWCPICAGKYKADTPELQAVRLNEIKQIAKSKGGECLSEEYVNQKIKLQFKCKEGHVWWAVPSSLKVGHWCNTCSTKRTSDSQRDNIDIFKQIIESKGGKCLTKKYVSQQKTKIYIECEKGHRWYAFPQHVKRGFWCRRCNGSAPHALDDVVKLAESRGGKCLSSKYKNDMTKVVWQCSEGHVWEATPNNIKRGKWCPNCSSGIGERACRLSFEKIFNTPFNKVRPSWLRNSSGYVLELDGYSEKLKVAFEHQGSQHYSSAKANHRFLKDNLKQNDKEKAEICSKEGVKIIYVPEVFTDTKLDMLIPFILKELDKKKISYPKEAHTISLDPREVYTYTKTKELELREQRAIELLKTKNASVVDIYRINSGVKVRVRCKNNHILITTISSIHNGYICNKCDN